MASAHAGNALKGGKMGQSGLQPGLVAVAGPGAGESCDGELPGLQSTAVVAMAVVVKTLTNNLASLDDNASMTELEGGVEGLLEAQILVVVSLHCRVTGIQVEW